MSAVACLRVLVDENRTDLPADALGPLVAKYTNIFLEVRWEFPRLAEPLSHYSYLLTDPRAEVLDTVELALLSQELQERLFGTGAEDGVKLVLFEGEPEAIQTFVGYSAAAVDAAMNDPTVLPEGGRLRRIAPDGSLIDVPEPAPQPKPVDPFRLVPAIDGVQGVWFTQGAAFVGDVVSCTPINAPTYYSVTDGEARRAPDAAEFDMACVSTALRLLVDFPVLAPLYLPVSFSTLIRPSQREAYIEMLGVLPPSTKGDLAATVYDVPRAPTFPALSTVRNALAPFVSSIDLRTRDPDFEIQHLAPKAFAGVTLMLPDESQEVRMAAIRRFAGRMADYRRRRIWPGLSNLRFRAERDLAVGLGIPFLSGPGVCRLHGAPVGGRPCAALDLPLLPTQPADLSVEVDAA